MVQRRKVRLFNLIRLFGGILLVIVLIEAGRSAIGNLIIRPYAAKWGTIEKGYWTSAIFLRDETLIKAPTSGKLRMIVKSGSRVPRGEPVAEVIPSEDALNEGALNEGALNEGDIANSCLLNAPEPGYMFFQYDRYEEKFGLRNDLQLGKADFEREYRIQSTETLVQAGDIIGKIINPFQQWVAVQVTRGEAGLPKVGATWWIKTSEGLNPIFYRKRVSLSKTNQSIFLFEERDINSDFLGHRLAKVYVIYRKVFGICIPKHALFKGGRDQTGKTRSYYVKVMKGDELKPQKVRVLETDSSNVIVEGIEFGTVIITR
ncbi:MAG TPA: HlyD family efflux transporter periplasmic adaptor subunit [Bacillota bacterium]|nr:HlyD family efflux transporter periplasmic adaptor subunit [Bacillota bacterium]